MTAVASPPSFTRPSRGAWAANGASAGQMNADELNRMFLPRKSLQRNNSSSSISSETSTSSTSTVGSTTPASTNGSTMSAAGDLSSWSNAPGTAAARKRPQPKTSWQTKPDTLSDITRIPGGRGQAVGGLNGSAPIHSPSPILPSQNQIAAPQAQLQALSRPMPESLGGTGGQAYLYLLSLNGTFERKTINVPFSPETLRIGRQTNAKTVPTAVNGFFDSKVLSRQHAEIWSDRQGKIWIRDVRSSNGTFVNGTRLSQENRESEPHELQTADHLELGIDIVSEDQKTVVHHKVAAKVEHAGFLNPSSNLLDMNFGDLDPSNGSMMMMGPQGGVPIRPRNGNQASMASNGRMVQGGGMVGIPPNGYGQQRGFFFSPISTEQIVKKLQHEMRNARLQSQDLGRTDHFIHTLLSKDDIKDIEKPEVLEPPKSSIVNGNGVSFRTDSKTRFSDPPAPPPQQPLPEKPDVPSLKRGITERPKATAQNISPIRQDGSLSQILQLTEALNSAKREIENQTSRMRDLEDMLRKEREARELAEELARRLEDASAAKINGIPVKPESEEVALEAAFEPPADEASSPNVDTPTSDTTKSALSEVEVVDASATHLHGQIESMVLEMKDLRQQLDSFKNRAETAEAERDADRKSLAEMALQLRKDALARETVSRDKAYANSNRNKPFSNEYQAQGTLSNKARIASSDRDRNITTSNEAEDYPTLSRANTITPSTSSSVLLSREYLVAESIPYASMIGVVIIGMGLMAYINGGHPNPRLER